MNPIKRAFLKTPLGYLEINGTEKGISKIEFLNSRGQDQSCSGISEALRQAVERIFPGETAQFYNRPGSFRFFISTESLE